MPKYVLVLISLFLACPAFSGTLTDKSTSIIKFEVTLSFQTKTETFGGLAFLGEAWANLSQLVTGDAVAVEQLAVAELAVAELAGAELAGAELAGAAEESLLDRLLRVSRLY